MRLWSIPGGPAHCVEWAFPRTATSPWNRSGGASFPIGFMRIESAVKRVLKQGLRTADIYEAGTKKVGTEEMGDAVVAALHA